MIKEVDTQKLARTSILGAIASMLFLFQFPLPFMPPFMSFDFSAIPEIIGTMSMGLGAGMSIIIVKILIKLVIKGTGSAFTGELQNLILSFAYILPIGYLHYKGRVNEKRTVLLGMILGTIISSIAAIFSNLYLIIPFYTKLYGLSMDNIIEMCSAVNKYINSEWKFVVLGIIPFNVIKCSVVTFVTYSLHPKLISIINKDKNKGEEYEVS